MPVKYWSFAGLMLTYWCNARCASCYLCCGPEAASPGALYPADRVADVPSVLGEGISPSCDTYASDFPQEMSIERAMELWQSLAEASPHGCRIHLSGGEPFGDWPRLIGICQEASRLRLGPLEKVETNGFWATDEAIVRDRLRALDVAGMRKLTISADPYHQQFVPIERARLLARLAQEILGPSRVQVRWRDWLCEGFNTDQLAAESRRELFARYVLHGRERLNGRAAGELVELIPPKLMAEFADKSCGDILLRSRHVHVDAAGRVMPGTCAGVVLGWCGSGTIADVWRRLGQDLSQRPVLGALVREGPVGLVDLAMSHGYRPLDAYAGKCHLCWELRRALAQTGLYEQELSPVWMYGAVKPDAGATNRRDTT